MSRQVLLSICSLLTDPNPEDPLVPEIAQVRNNNCDENDHENNRNMSHDNNAYCFQYLFLLMHLFIFKFLNLSSI